MITANYFNSGTHDEKIRQYVYGLAIAFFFTGSVWANNFSKMPIPEITHYAEQGNLEAQLYLASAYYEGYRVPQSFEQAALWHHKATEQNSMEAQFLLGVMYSEGLGVKKDEKQSFEWFKKAAFSLSKRNIQKMQLISLHLIMLPSFFPLPHR